jgi:hypothetical protein
LGKFRPLPVVENGEVNYVLDITKCLYDAISRLEKAIDKGIALAAAVEWVEGLVGGNFSDISTFSSAIITFTFMYTIVQPRINRI